MKLFFCDIETTGLYPSKHSIWQLAAIIDEDGQTLDEFKSNIKPTGDRDEKIADMIPDTEVLDKYPVGKLVYEELLELLTQHIDKFNREDKLHFIGYNSSFDYQFMRTSFFKHMKDKFFGSWFWNPPIDVMQMAAKHLMNKRHELADFKLMTVAEYMGVKVDEEMAHDALYDIKITRELYYTLAGGEI